MRGMRLMGAVAGAAACVALTACPEDGIAIHGIQPERGNQYGGDRVTIEGRGFQSEAARGMTIYFGERAVEPRQILGDRRIVLNTPPGPPGESVDVQLIFEDARQVVYRDAFEYVRVDPPTGGS